MKEFFTTVRAKLGALSATQVEGFEIILKATDGLPMMHRAYMLATTWHETSATMQPIFERGPVKYFKQYEPPSAKARTLGNTLRGDGYRYRGRGYVQLTGRSNYKKASQALGVDFLAKPDLALQSGSAATILVRGMSEGWFTGFKLDDHSNFTAMRKVVNGTDNASKIADYAEIFLKALLVEHRKPVAAPPVVGKGDAAGAVVAAGGASAAHYAGIGPGWIGAAAMVAVVAWVAWKIWQARG